MLHFNIPILNVFGQKFFGLSEQVFGKKALLSKNGSKS
jgi:hypothetical protein